MENNRRALRWPNVEMCLSINFADDRVDRVWVDLTNRRLCAYLRIFLYTDGTCCALNFIYMDITDGWSSSTAPLPLCLIQFTFTDLVTQFNGDLILQIKYLVPLCLYSGPDGQHVAWITNCNCIHIEVVGGGGRVHWWKVSVTNDWRCRDSGSAPASRHQVLLSVVIVTDLVWGR